jgi:PWWP domain.
MAKILFMEGSQFIVVWAKIRGYPWWPGVVIPKQIEITNSAYYSELPQNSLHTVKFIGENTQ